MRNIIYIILDGLADLPVKQLGQKTPLEAAYTPNLDRLAQMGVTGSVNPVDEGVFPESDVAVISLLGYDVRKYYTGRGPLEAFACGISVDEGNLALRVNFASAEDDGRTIKDRRVAKGLSSEEVVSLVRLVNSRVTLSDATFELKNTVGHRGVLVIRGIRSKLSGWITNTDPAYSRQGLIGVPCKEFANMLQDCRPMPGYENLTQAIEAANLVNEFTKKSSQVLNESAVNKKRISENKLPANLFLARYAGDRLPDFPPVGSLYPGFKFGCFVEMPVERGIALLSGMDIIAVPSSSGHLDVDYPVWAKVALDAAKNYNGVYIHIKGPDEAGHDADPLKKKTIIEAIDKFFFAGLIPNVNFKETIVCVTADHTTDSVLGRHSTECVPLLISGGRIRPDGTLSFSEKAAKLGSLGLLRGQDILPSLVRLAQE
jgi:2,3-bisphosphoglycerate-independent phosphoglycerate mutase